MHIQLPPRVPPPPPPPPSAPAQRKRPDPTPARIRAALALIQTGLESGDEAREQISLRRARRILRAA